MDKPVSCLSAYADAVLDELETILVDPVSEYDLLESIQPSATQSLADTHAPLWTQPVRLGTCGVNHSKDDYRRRQC